MRPTGKDKICRLAPKRVRPCPRRKDTESSLNQQPAQCLGGTQPAMHWLKLIVIVGAVFVFFFVYILTCLANVCDIYFFFIIMVNEYMHTIKNINWKYMILWFNFVLTLSSIYLLTYYNEFFRIHCQKNSLLFGTGVFAMVEPWIQLKIRRVVVSDTNFFDHHLLLYPFCIVLIGPLYLQTHVFLFFFWWLQIDIYHIKTIFEILALIVELFLPFFFWLMCVWELFYAPACIYHSCLQFEADREEKIKTF